MADYNTPNANLRISRTPVAIRKGTTDGEYWSADKSPYGSERITVATPTGGEGMDAFGIVKHEALHQFFNEYPDADRRMFHKVLGHQDQDQGDLRNQLPFEVGPHALMHNSSEHIPADYGKYIQQSLLDVAQGPEQQRHMRSLVSMIPPEALTPALRDKAQVYYNGYQPEIQRQLKTPGFTYKRKDDPQ